MRPLFAIALTIGLAAASNAAEGLKVPESSFDFGLMPKGSVVKHFFWFKSTGTDTLRINKIVTGCTCALMPLQQDWLAPGDSMRVGITWETGARIGKIGRYPRAEFRDRTSPVHMSLTGLVMADPDSARPLHVKPYKFELSKTERLDLDSLSFVMTNKSDGKLSLRVVSYPVEECVYEFPQEIEGGASLTGFIKVRPEFRDQEFVSSITIEASDSRHTRLTIPIRRKFY